MNVLAILPGYVPSTIINVITPLQALQAQGKIEAVIRMEWDVTPAEVARADVLVLCRNSDADYRPIYELAQTFGIPMIYDLDDHVLGAPEGSESHKYFSDPGRREQFEWLLRCANLVRVHSPALREVVQPYNPQHKLVWAAIDWSLVPEALPTLDSQTIRIVYAAQRETGKTLFRYLRADLERILNEYGDRVHVHFLGYNPPDFTQYPQVTQEPFEGDYARYFSAFTRAGYAIGLAPMIDDLFHNSKTNIKYRDYAAAGAAGLYADTPLYHGNGVIDGETGLLVSGEEGSWYPAIKRLIEQTELVERIRQNARLAVAERYRMDVVGAMWMEDLEAMPARLPLTDVQQEAAAATRWWFTLAQKPDHPAVAGLRGVLKRVLPQDMKQRYYQLRHRLLRLKRLFR